MSKLQRLRDNIEALQHAMTSTSEYDSEILNKYSGFGGLTFVLNPLEPTAWSKSDMMYYQDTVRLHELLREEAGSDKEYQMWVESLKASTLTAYYTPHMLAFTIMKELANKTIYRGKMPNDAFRNMLDPAAGMGVFVSTGHYHLNHCTNPHDFKIVAYEKDLLTGLLLSRKYPSSELKRDSDYDIRVKGFETIPASELGKYDLVATNVPFGDIRVFDPEYSNSKSRVRRDAAKMIHRYYVLKGLDCLREGGVLAYIITSNYLNRDGEQIGEALKQARLIGAYRLANNLFKESGTEVGTDLLVMQKDSERGALTEEETMLLTQYEDGGCPTNMYFDMWPERVIATAWMVDTDAYGKRSFVYKHRDGVQGIAKQLGDVLSKDLEKNLCADLGGNTAENGTKGTERKSEPKMTEKQKVIIAIHKAYTALYEYEAKEMQENTELRKELNRLYDAFVAEYGPLNYAPNRGDVKKVAKELLSLEYRSNDNGRWTKADIFERPVAFSTDEMHSVTDAHEALAQSLNDYGKPDVRYMAALTGKSEEEICDELDGRYTITP